MEGKLSDELRKLQQCTETLTLQQLLDRVGDRGVLLVMILLNLPFCLPIPLPGLSTPFGLALMLLAIRLGIGIPRKLPRFVGDREIPSRIFKTILEKAIGLTGYSERIIRPRGSVWCQHLVFHRIHSFVLLLMALLLALPLPIPTTNFAPAAGIMLLTIGLLERDVLVVGLGYLAAILGIAWFGYLMDSIVKVTESIVRWVSLHVPL